MDQETKDRNVKFMGLLMPYARGKRDELRASPRMVHYTNAEAANGLLRTEQLWLRDCSLMTDYTEVKHGIGLINAYLTDATKRAEFSAAVDLGHPGVAATVLAMFDEWAANRAGKTFIMCFSEHAPKHAPLEDRYGRLSMWREYGGKQGVAVVFNIPLDSGTEGTRLFFSPVGYFDSIEEPMDAIVASLKSETAFLKTIDQTTMTNGLFMMLVAAATSLKHPSYHEELEWRLLYLPTTYRSGIVTAHQMTLGGLDQTVYKVSLPALAAAGMPGLNYNTLIDRIIVGGTEHPEEIQRFMQDALRDKGVRDADRRVHISGVPFRLKDWSKT